MAHLKYYTVYFITKQRVNVTLGDNNDVGEHILSQISFLLMFGDYIKPINNAGVRHSTV